MAANVSFPWVLNERAVNLARFSGPAPSCCSGTLAWHQDFFSSTPHLWSSITGTGLTGAWLPPVSGDTSDLLMNGRHVTGLQMNAAHHGLDAVDRVFSDLGSIWTNGTNGGQFRFRIDSLTIAPAPEHRVRPQRPLESDPAQAGRPPPALRHAALAAASRPFHRGGLALRS